MTIDDPNKFDDGSTFAAFHAQKARVDESIKAAAAKGVDVGVKSSPGEILKPPRGYDPFDGRVCQGPGLQRAGFGKARICGRQAVMVMRKINWDIPERKSLDDHARQLNEMLAMQAYGGVNGKIYAGSGQKVGNLLPDHDALPSDGDDFRCYFHGQAAHREHLHPDDNNGVIPDVRPATEQPVIGVDRLDSSRQWRTTGQDGTFCWVSDGKVTVMILKRDYIAYLRENGALPESGQLL